jgi:hypothetical protein
MTDVSSPIDIVAALGAPLLHVVVAGADRGDVRDVFLAEPHDAVPGERGDLVLGIGVPGTEDAGQLVRRWAETGAAAVIMRTAVATPAPVAEAAKESAITLVAAGDGVPWAHLVWLLRGVIDRSLPPSGASSAADTSPGAYDDLFALADTVAAIIGAPVTFEDSGSRVLAYSSGQGETDTARVATIVGRRVPEDVAAHYRARGVFRRLVRSDEPFLVPAGPDGTLPRLVVPVRAGGEWLGSIWAVVDGPVDDATTAELRRAASVLALHLLRLRAQADIVRRSATELIRSALWQYSPERIIDQALPGAGPWRVVALNAPEIHESDEHLQVWETVLRRHGWRRAVLADLAGDVFAVVSAEGGDGPGTWAWLQAVVREMDDDGRGWMATAGTPATAAELPRSRVEAAELLGIARSGQVSDPAVSVESAWDSVVLHRVLGAVDLAVPGSPLRALLDHDAEHGTAYVPTLGAWLEHYGEPLRAAKALMIHPNTLRYRMRRLLNVADINLHDPRQRFALYLQVEAAQRAGR